MSAETVTLWLTKDHAGVNLWRHRPKYCFGTDVYFNGGETLTLAEGAFPKLHQGACVQAAVSVYTAMEETCLVCGEKVAKKDGHIAICVPIHGVNCDDWPDRVICPVCIDVISAFRPVQRSADRARGIPVSS